MKVNHKASQEVHDLYERIEKLENENKLMRILLEDGVSFGLQPEDCKEIISKLSKKED